MAVGEFEAITIGAGDDAATLSIVDGKLVISAQGALTGVRIESAGTVEIVGSSLVRVDGGARVEVHGDEIVRVDAGGVGYTLTPDSWHFYYPWAGGAYMPSPPEHPDSGGTNYVAAGDNYAAWLAEYYAQFPEPPAQ